MVNRLIGLQHFPEGKLPGSDVFYTAEEELEHEQTRQQISRRHHNA